MPQQWMPAMNSTPELLIFFRHLFCFIYCNCCQVDTKFTENIAIKHFICMQAGDCLANAWPHFQGGALR